MTRISDDHQWFSVQGLHYDIVTFDSVVNLFASL